jgi:hypothetical protein
MSQRHATDVTSLVSGTLFAGVTAVWLLNVTDLIDLEQAWLGGPLVLIVAGVVGLLATLGPGRRRTSGPDRDPILESVGAAPSSTATSSAIPDHANGGTSDPD